MSSYIVETKTIHRIITHIDRHRDQIGFVCVCRRLGEMGYDLTARSGLEQLGADVIALNYAATNQHYGTDDAPEVRYEYRHDRASTLQVLKSLRCLLYQCSEGDVPESRLFGWLESYERSLLRHIVDQLPEYTATEWG